MLGRLVLLLLAAVTQAAVKPNLVLILTDDQSSVLDSIDHMPKLHRHVISQGVEVTHSFVATPVCCPSRSEIYTGKYIHNIGVFNNSAGAGGCSSLQWQEGPERFNVAWYLNQRGYATSFAGKYMNNYGMGSNNGSIYALPLCLNSSATQVAANMDTACAQKLEYVPRGWDNWQGLKGNSVYYNYSMSNNGVPEVHGDDYATDYFIDVVKNRSLDFMDAHAAKEWGAGATSRGEERKPFFLVAAVPGIHEPADPAPQHADYAKDLVAPRTPNFNLVMEDDGRHWMIDQVNYEAQAMNDTVISFVDLLYRRRLAVLQSVDDLVEAFCQKLESFGEMDNTFIIYTADNGYHLGQFAVALDKRQPYETDVRVPFFARGPGLPRNVTRTSGFVVNIDLAPTFLDWAGFTPEELEATDMDGESAAGLLTTGESARKDFLVEYHGEAWDGCVNYLAHGFPDSADLFNKFDGLNCGTRGPASYVTPPLWDGTETWSSIQDTRNNTYSCVRTVTDTENLQYCEWESGEVEYYVVGDDAWEMKNLAPTMDEALQERFHDRILELKGCQGRTCHSSALSFQ